MYVGVILVDVIDDICVMSIPHVCGGDPPERGTVVQAIRYSPCMWG